MTYTARIIGHEGDYYTWEINGPHGIHRDPDLHYPSWEEADAAADAELAELRGDAENVPTLEQLLAGHEPKHTPISGTKMYPACACNWIVYVEADHIEARDAHAAHLAGEIRALLNTMVVAVRP